MIKLNLKKEFLHSFFQQLCLIKAQSNQHKLELKIEKNNQIDKKSPVNNDKK